jgi:nitric oxide reductase activation protein
LQRALEREGLSVGLTDLRRVRVGASTGGSTFKEVNDFLERNPGHRGGMVDPSDPAETGQQQEFLDKGSDVALINGRGTLYPEWDLQMGDYKADWVRVTEYEVTRKDGQFVDRVLGERGEIIGQVRRKFEAIRDDGMRRIKRVKDGDLIDIDAAIQARSDFKTTGYVEEAIYSRLRRREQGLAVGFLVDLSSSTNEPAGFDERSILEVEKEALMVVCEAVDALGQESAVWGFSGSGREEVSFYIAKRFQDRWDRAAKERIGGLAWKMENRDGGAIRHAVSLFQEHQAETKLLVVLSDGRPLDCGSKEYRDEYGRADTRRALLEAKSAGISPYCITVDPSGANYLPELYGSVGYTVIENVTSLPGLIPRIIRQLTR